jgi:Subtilase family
VRWRFLLIPVILAVSLPVMTPSAYAADATRSAEWFLSTLKIATAHKITQGRGVTVAVIDTGVFVHDDLKDRVLTGYDYTTPAGGNGQTDTDGHGTWIAGVIAGRGHGTGLGMLGIAPSARILPIRVSAVRPPPSDGTVAQAIQQAMKRGAKIIHLAGFGGDQASMDAVAKAVNAGVIVIAQTGNTGVDKVIPPPASWPGVITASGVDQSGKASPLYMTGSKVDFSAPGDGVITTDKIAGAYVTPVSTSMASAMVAGVAALVWAKYPKLKAAQVIAAMRTGATDKGAKGRDPVFGSGVVNPVGALEAAQAIASPSPSANPSPSLSPTPVDSPAAGDATEAPASPAAVAAAGTSPFVLLAVALGVIVLLVGGFLGLFVLRRKRFGPGGVPGQAWAPQPVALPPPVAPLAIESAQARPVHPASPVQPAPSLRQAPSMQPASPMPPAPAVSEATQPLRTVATPAPAPEQRPSGHSTPGAEEPAPLMNRPPIDPTVLNQPTVSVHQPRFAFPPDEVDGTSIYDTATFPTVKE